MQRPGQDLCATAQRPDPPILRSTLFHGTWNTALASRGIPHQWSPSAPIRHCIGEQGKSTHSGGPAAPIRDGRDQSSISDRKCHEHRVESSYQSRQGDSYHPIRDTGIILCRVVQADDCVSLLPDAFLLFASGGIAIYILIW